ncbi:hypothetical protein E2C01_046821 [Portunus trituberculatus]|uniref:Uncharacterized protein n=1 Tax=Portunus trituberculatus TaxID=210409 RepID=A0A5B7FYS9_PORTR|nr:hypothetical protein [Portunus trituberculatus]
MPEDASLAKCFLFSLTNSNVLYVNTTFSKLIPRRHKVPLTQRRSSVGEGKALRKAKRQTYPTLVKSRKRKKRRQHKRKKEKLRNLRRKGRKFRKRRRQVRQHEEAKNASVLSASILLDTQPVPSLASLLPQHNAHLVELLTGGNKQFLVLPPVETSENFTNTKETTQNLRKRLGAKQLIFLPFQVLSGGSLKWLPYNPNIRVSIHVDGKQHRDLTDRTHLTHSPTQEQSK